MEKRLRRPQTWRKQSLFPVRVNEGRLKPPAPSKYLEGISKYMYIYIYIYINIYLFILVFILFFF